MRKTSKSAKKRAPAEKSSKARKRVAQSSASSTSTFETSPEREAFCASYDKGEAQVLWTRLVADLETPVSAYLKIADNQPMSFLLESVEGGASRGRYSIIGLQPDIVWRASGNTSEINRNPIQQPDAFAPLDGDTLLALRNLLAESQIELPEALPPMSAGVFGYMGYDTVRLIEHLPDVPRDVLCVPDAIMMRPTLMVIFDTVKDELTVVTPVRPSPDMTASEAFKAANKRLHTVVELLESPLSQLASVDLPIEGAVH